MRSLALRRTALPGKPRGLQLLLPVLLLGIAWLLPGILPFTGIPWLQQIFGTLVLFLTFKEVALWLIDTLWPVMTTYLQKEFQDDFSKLKPLQKMVFAAAFFILLLYALIATLGAVA